MRRSIILAGITAHIKNSPWKQLPRIFHMYPEFIFIQKWAPTVVYSLSEVWKRTKRWANFCNNMWTWKIRFPFIFTFKVQEDIARVWRVVGHVDGLSGIVYNYSAAKEKSPKGSICLLESLNRKGDNRLWKINVQIAPGYVLSLLIVICGFVFQICTTTREQY